MVARVTIALLWTDPGDLTNIVCDSVDVVCTRATLNRPREQRLLRVTRASFVSSKKNNFGKISDGNCVVCLVQ